MWGARRSQLIRVIIFLGSRVLVLGRGRTKRSPFIVSGQLLLWNPLVLVSAAAYQAFQWSRPPASAIWLIRSCGSIYLQKSTTCLPLTIILSLVSLVLAVGIPLSLDCRVRVTPIPCLATLLPAK
jgi:hypothetical protein